MKTNPITPPPELVEQWEEQWCNIPVIRPSINSYIATQAAQWGADQELQSTLGLMATLNIRGVDYVRNARRPKPPSLKEQALVALQFVDEKLDLPLHNHCNAIHTIRRALEALDD